MIAEKKRITKESFQKFLEGQDRYKLDPSNDYEELAQEQNIALANFRRKKLSQTGIRGSNGNIKYLTFDEASYLAKESLNALDGKDVLLVFPTNSGTSGKSIGKSRDAGIAQFTGEDDEVINSISK